MAELAIARFTLPSRESELPFDQVHPREVSRALSRLQDLIDRHPDLPFKKYRSGFAYPCHGGTDAENRAEVDRIAAILGVSSWTDSAGTHQAVFDCGADVIYKAYAIPNMRRTRRPSGAMPGATAGASAPKAAA